MGNKTLDEKDIIIVQKMYHISRKSIVSLAKIYDCTTETIQYYVDEHPQLYKSALQQKRPGRLNRMIKKDAQKISRKGFGQRSKSVGMALALYIRDNLFIMGISPPQLAKEMGVASQVVHRWLSGGIPSKEHLEPLFTFFQTGHKSLEDVMEDHRYHKERR